MLKKILVLYLNIDSEKIGLRYLFFVIVFSSLFAIIQIFLIKEFTTILALEYSGLNFAIFGYHLLLDKLSICYNLIFVSLVIFTLRLLENYLVANIAHKYASISSNNYFSSFINSRFKYLCNINLNEIKNKFTVENNIYYNQIITPSLLLFNNIFSILCLTLLLLFFFNFLVLFILGIIAFTYFLIIFFLRPHLKSINLELSRSYVLLSDFVSLSYFNIRDIKLKNNTFFYKKKYSLIFNNISLQIKRSNLISNFPKFFIEFISILVIVIVVVLLNDNQHNDFLGNLSIIIFIGSRFLPQIQQSYKSYVLLKSSVYAYDSFNDFSKFGPLIPPIKKATKKNNTTFTFHTSIMLKNITFNYYSKNIIKNFTCEIKKGYYYKIMGASGSGKSTLINIISCLLQPSSGSISIDGITLKEDLISSYQKLISLVSQTSYFVKGTTSDNVTLDANISFDSEKLCTVLKIVGFYNNALNDDENLEYRVEEFGTNLSGGQKQRLAIARALYNNFDILILDEATNALDNKSESFIFKNIKKYFPKITLIYISHKLSKFSPNDIIINI